MGFPIGGATDQTFMILVGLGKNRLQGLAVQLKHRRLVRHRLQRLEFSLKRMSGVTMARSAGDWLILCFPETCFQYDIKIWRFFGRTANPLFIYASKYKSHVGDVLTQQHRNTSLQ